MDMILGSDIDLIRVRTLAE